MDKRTYFLLAMKAGNYKYLDWIYSVFCLSKDAQAVKHTYPYQIQADPTGYFFQDPSGEQIRLTDASPNTPIFTLKEKLTLTPNDVPTLQEPTTVTYGNLLANYILLIEPFGQKLPYLKGEFSIGKIEEQLLPRLKNDPQDPAERTEDAIYISEYLKFADSCFYLTGLTQVCVWAATEKIMLPPEGIQEYKAQLLEEYKDRLHDAAAIAEIDAKLVAYDKAYLKGDPGTHFLLSKKSTNVVRKKKFLMHGAEMGVDSSVSDVTLIRNSLDEGWDVKAFPAMNNSLRLGSYSRGAETMLGGVEVKWMLRASSNINVTEDDCGTTLGMPIDVTEANKKTLVGFYLLTKQGSILIENEDQARQYIGKKVLSRSPMYCKLDKTDYCKKCIGTRLSETPYALSSAVSSYGSIMLGIFMSAMHGKVLETAKMDINSALF